MIVHCHQLELDCGRRDGSREVLRGDPRPGNAWDDYQAADVIIQSTLGATPGLSEMATRSKTADWAAGRLLLGRLAPALELVRRGTRHVDGKYPRSAHRWNEPLCAELGRLGNLLMAQEHVEAESGNGTASAELLLDLIRLSQDYAGGGLPFHLQTGGFVAEKALEELRRLLMKGVVAGPMLEPMERELEILERTQPPFGPSMLCYQASLGQALEEDGAMAYLQSWPGWRHAFSPRLLAASEYFRYGERSGAVLNCDRMTWPDECAAWDLFTRDDPRGEVLRAHDYSPHRKLAREARVFRAQLRLVRMAAHVCRTGEWAELEDPFGGTLRHSTSENRHKIWSMGPDGEDNGGLGGWEYSQGRDIVIEVSR
jgi:hypothetical protein